MFVKPGDYVVTEPIAFRGKEITVRSEAGSERTKIRLSEKPADEERASVIIFENRKGRDLCSSGSRLQVEMARSGVRIRGTVEGEGYFA